MSCELLEIGEGPSPIDGRDRGGRGRNAETNGDGSSRAALVADGNTKAETDHWHLAFQFQFLNFNLNFPFPLLFALFPQLPISVFLHPAVANILYAHCCILTVVFVCHSFQTVRPL